MHIHQVETIITSHDIVSLFSSLCLPFVTWMTHTYIYIIFQKGLEPGEIQTSVGSGTAEILFSFVITLLKIYPLYPTAFNIVCVLDQVGQWNQCNLYLSVM